jgi:hypothetical protein
MNNHHRRGLAVAGILLGLAVSACSTSRSAGTGALRAETYAFTDGAGSTGHVFRAVGADGAEVLHGETDLAAGTHVVEDAVLDDEGRLSRLELVVTRGCGGPEEEHLVLDRARRTVRAAALGGVVEWPVATDAPWALAPLARGASTPIAAWISRRAAASGPLVRIIEADSRSSYRAPVDQVAIDTEVGATVILGGDAAEIDGAFVQRLSLAGRGVTLTRTDGAASKVACASLD